MAEDYNATGVLRIPGLGYDGVKWDDMIDKLYATEKKKLERLQKWKADWKTRYDSFDEIKTELVKLQSDLQKLNSIQKFLIKSSTSSKPEVATATLGQNASSGSHTLTVLQPATKGITSVETSMTDKFASINEGDVKQLEYSFKGENYTIDIPTGTSLEGLKNIINNHPTASKQISASLLNGGNGYILQISTKETGAENKLTINPSSLSGLKGLTMTDTWSTPKSEYSSTLNTTITNTSKVIWTDTDYVKNQTYKENNDPLYNPNYGAAKSATFTWKENGEEFSVELKHGATYDDLVKAINNKKGTTVGSVTSTTTAMLVQGGTAASPTYTLKLTADSAVTDAKGVGSSPTASVDFGGGTFVTSSQDKVTYASVSPAKTVAQGDDQTFSWTDSAGTHKVDVPSGTTISGLVSLINKESPGAAALVGNSSSGYKLQINGTINTDDTKLKGLPNQTTPSWHEQDGSNAQYKINGWPAGDDYYESASNTLKDVEPGVSFTIKTAGTTTVTIELDTAQITENVQSFVDSVNSVREKFKELTKVDDNKELMDLQNADSQFEMEKGSALTGNYGIQMIESRLKDIISSSGLGFVVPRTSSDPNGDLFSSLAEIGITTNSDQGSDNYGMLELRTSSSDTSTKWGAANFTDALNQNPEAIARIFSASNDDGVTHSIPDFSFEARTSKTELGTYPISYAFDASGGLTSASINGYDLSSGKLLWDASNQTLQLSDDVTDAAAGLKIHIDNMKLTDANGNRKGGDFSGSIVIDGAKNQAATRNTYGEKSYTMSDTTLTYSGAAPQTKPGTYDVRYSVENGKVVNATINGKKAVYANGMLKMDASETDDAKGIEIVASSLKEGDHIAQVSVRQGIVNGLMSALKGKATIEDPGILDSEHGTLAILKNNYRDIMNNAQERMEREQSRLEKYRQSLILKFARLEKQLSIYNQKNETVKSQIQQVSSSGSK